MRNGKKKYDKFLDHRNFPESPDYPEAPNHYDKPEYLLAVGKAIVYGILIGAAFWASILAAFWYWVQ